MTEIRGKTILVAGATGQQGRAVTERLMDEGWSVRALTRNPHSEKAQLLARRGADVVPADFDDPESLRAALKGAHGVFSVVNFGLPGVGPEGEVRQGKAIADAAHSTGVAHFIYSSVGGAERKTGIPHFESKWQIEEHIRQLGLRYTILRPVAFMDNYEMLRPMIEGGVFPAFGIRADKAMQVIALDDIAAFAAIAFAHPDDYLGTALEIAGDELTTLQVAAVFSRVLQRPVQAQDIPINAGGDSPVAAREQEKMLRWFNERGYQADLSALRQIHPGLLTLEAWARQHGWGFASGRSGVWASEEGSRVS